MKTPLLGLKQFIAISIVGMGCASVALPQASLADTGSNIFQDLSTQQSGDPLGRRSDEVNNLGVFDLIHRFNQGNSVWDANAQNQQLNDAAAEFKKKQEAALQQQAGSPQNQPGVQVTSPVTAP